MKQQFKKYVLEALDYVEQNLSVTVVANAIELHPSTLYRVLKEKDINSFQFKTIGAIIDYVENHQKLQASKEGYVGELNVFLQTLLSEKYGTLYATDVRLFEEDWFQLFRAFANLDILGKPHRDKLSILPLNLANPSPFMFHTEYNPNELNENLKKLFENILSVIAQIHAHDISYATLKLRLNYEKVSNNFTLELQGNALESLTTERRHLEGTSVNVSFRLDKITTTIQQPKRANFIMMLLNHYYKLLCPVVEIALQLLDINDELKQVLLAEFDLRKELNVEM